MYKKHVFFTFLLAIGLSSLNATYGQYRPDTTLTYSSFLRQCQDFARQSKDEIWVVNFWNSYNGASLNTLSDLKNIYSEYRNKPVRFVSVSVDKVRSSWEKRFTQYEIPGEQLFLPSEEDYTFLKNAFAHNSLPGIFVVNSDAQVQRVRDTRELRTILAIESEDLPNRPYRETPLDIADIDPNPSTNPKSETPVDKGNIVNGWVVHEVVAGETLFSLYRKYGIKVDVIKKTNGLRNNTIKVGQKLKIKKI